MEKKLSIKSQKWFHIKQLPEAEWPCSQERRRTLRNTLLPLIRNIFKGRLIEQLFTGQNYQRNCDFYLLADPSNQEI